MRERRVELFGSRKSFLGAVSFRLRINRRYTVADMTSERQVATPAPTNPRPNLKMNTGRSSTRIRLETSATCDPGTP
jgi:hypothetical protein